MAADNIAPPVDKPATSTTTSTPHLQFWTDPSIPIASGQPGHFSSTSSPSTLDNSNTNTSPLTTSSRYHDIATKAASLFSSPPMKILRVSQLDAESLDAELGNMVQEGFWRIFTHFGDHWKEMYQPEVSVILQYLMSHLSIYATGASYGSQLQNLKYRNESRHFGKYESAMLDAPLTTTQKALHAILHIGAPYAWIRVNRYATLQEWSEMPSNSWQHQVWKYLQVAENVYKVVTTVNFLVFLYDGRYRSVIDRILSMRLVYTRREMARQVSFEFMNRQLVWHAFTEFLLYLVPLINLSSLKNTILRTLSPKSSSDVNLHPSICAICFANSANVRSSQVHTPTGVRWGVTPGSIICRRTFNFAENVYKPVTRVIALVVCMVRAVGLSVANGRTVPMTCVRDLLTLSLSMRI
ncbi:hypothetical protein SmJEL517_g03015 [Synchytrium microbalum]|uniref:RING-type E3 ubiquitin transferase (cysteine targeting) n=1 Tax=Synchytrium microbalum TaxID=1806994 RepID=A0A507C8K9_9FUNG|nr:uncharacterized protein SmJEL517_g03015 [Synchytrium microbalum]TPX34314.1 hypothetical protein SmJEL517_g03015 [Synchytrium microbalum]